MRYLGEEGYLRLTRSALEATDALIAGLRGLPGARVVGQPDATLVAFTFDDADVFAVGDGLARRGWVLDQQQPPPSLHCTVNAVHGPVIPQLLADLQTVLSDVRRRAATGSQRAYGSLE
jgi:glutamate/tyrosine decarboxylase-like PLP-dependent enzyme